MYSFMRDNKHWIQNRYSSLSQRRLWMIYSLCVLSLIGCTPNTTSPGSVTVGIEDPSPTSNMPDSPNPDDPNEPDRNQRDQPIYTDLMINESKIRSQLFQDHLLVKIPINSNANVDLSGLISLELLDLRQEEDQVIGQEEVEFSINNEQETIVEIRLNQGVSFENPSDLVNYVLRWGARIDRGEGSAEEESTEEERAAEGSGTEDEEVLWGRRSLYTTYDYTEIQWVGTSEVLQGKSHLLRFIARSQEESMLPPNVQVNIKAVRQLESEEMTEGDESDEEEEENDDSLEFGLFLYCF